MVKTNKAIEKIAFDNIICIEALHNYIAIHTIQKKIIVYQSLKNIEQSLPQTTFLKVHKSFIIAIHKVQRIVDNAKLDIGLNMLIPISRNIKTEAIATIKKHLTTHL